MPRFHDCGYVKARNALIPQAAEVADELSPCVSPEIDGGARRANWNLYFSLALDKLYEQSVNGADEP